MTQLTRHSAYMLIEDQLDVIGQKYRVIRLLRGVFICLTFAAAASITAALLAHFAGQGALASTIFFTWIVVLVAGVAWWVGRPLLLRPRPVEVARIVERRIPDLHNGLTNSVLLARADDLQSSPWLGPIFNEILSSTQKKPLGKAITLRDLQSLGIKLGASILAMLVLVALPPVRQALGHGWRQMLNPAKFVPTVGSVKILKISPGSIELWVGQPLEISVLAEDPSGRQPQAKIIFDNQKLKPELLTPQLTADDKLQYAYRLDRVEEPLRWRVEVGGTQTDWFKVDVLRQIEIEGLSLAVTPPTYTGKPAVSVLLKPGQMNQPLGVLEGSQVALTASVKQAVGGALLQVDQAPPTAMSASTDGRQFSETVFVMKDMELAILLTKAGQVITRIPDNGLLRIRCTKDTAPAIDMRWPTQDTTAPAKAALKVSAVVRDDYGIKSARILVGTSPDQPMSVAHGQRFDEPAATAEVSGTLNIPEKLRVHGQSIRVQVEATDNRNLGGLIDLGIGAPTSKQNTEPQTTSTLVYRIELQDAQEIVKNHQEQMDKLRRILIDLIKKQEALLALSQAWNASARTMPQIHSGQLELRNLMQETADKFPFEPDDKIVQKTLLVLAQNPAADAISLAAAIGAEKDSAEQLRLNDKLQSRQRRIIETLQALLGRLNTASPSTRPTRPGGDLENEKEKLKELNEALKKYIAEEKRILDAEATLAKKPVDSFDDNDRKLAEELKMAQEKLDAFMQEKISDFSKLAEQDMANSSLLKEMLEVFSEVTMQKGALKEQAKKMDIPLEEMGLELAKEISSNLEKWLMDKPDRLAWNQEDPVDKVDVPMAELPKELEDMVGELMEQQEDLFEEMEDTAANWADSLDKGAGWDAMDGPIANMSAKGVTGNALPNNNEMNGRSGEGRSGKSSGEMVEETASGKGGRNTPTRLDPTPFQQGQIKDEGKDPVGGATGGGKISGQGGAGLEGPVPPKDLREKMQRLANKQAELRNKAERLNLDRKAFRYDNFKLTEAVLSMRHIESDLHANRYNNALRKKDVLLDKLDTSHLLLSGQLHAQRDTSPTMSQKLQDQINDADKGKYPPGWAEMLKEYYRKLSQQ